MYQFRSNLRTQLAVALLAGVLAGGCAETEFLVSAYKDVNPPGSAPSTYKVGKPYNIGGVWYYPKVDYEYSETGIASWYGSEFHGKSTANGESFDMNGVSAAHRTLPLPSIVRVTNLDNGRSLLVRVNDRGPFAHGRIIDMSRRGAQLLGFEMQGTAPVRVDIVADASRRLAAGDMVDIAEAGEAPAPQASPSVAVAVKALPGAEEIVPTQVAMASPPPERAAVPVTAVGEVSTVPISEAPKMFIQAGAFSQFENAHRVRAGLVGVGDAAISQTGGDQRLFRVRIGPLDNVASADQTLEAVIAAGYPDARIVVD